MTSGAFTINRRQFVISTAVVGGGLMIGFSQAGKAHAATAKAAPWDQTAGGAEFTGFLSISPDNIVTIRTTKTDIGNGAFSAQAMIAVEELKADWKLVRGEMLPPNRNFRENNYYSNMSRYFSGRTTTPDNVNGYLQLGASARERLRQAAATRWGVPLGQVEAANSTLTHTPSERKLTYGEVAAEAAAIKLDPEPKPRPPSAWTSLGKESPPRLNLPHILNGSQKYGMDVQVPGMVYAALMQVPTHGGRLKSFDFNAVKNMPGVRTVIVVNPDDIRPGLPDGVRPARALSASQNGPQAAVAVVADHYWQAQTALNAMPIEWNPGEGAKWTTKTIYDGAFAAAKNPTAPNVVRDLGDVGPALESGKRVEATYFTPYMDHFLMEGMSGVALVKNDRVDVWISTQDAEGILYIAADETGVHPKDVHVHHAWTGIGFGRRVYGDEGRMVVAVANKLRGTPVKVMWSREETQAQGRYRDLMAGHYKATLGDDGMPKAFFASVAGTRPSPTRALAEHPYQTNIPNWRVQATTFNANVMTGPWRGPIYNSNTFFTETFVNELAETARIDPIEYRRRLLAKFDDPNWIKVLDELAQKSGWGQSLPRGTAQGVAIGNWGMGLTRGGPTPFSGTTIAAVVTAEVTRRGNIAIPRVDVAFDAGGFLNRDMVIAQIEGGTILSLGSALYEELNVANGAIVEKNLDHYRVMRQSDPALPQEIHVHFGAMSGHERISEIGEPPMGPPPPALAHAIYRITGKWVREEPFSKYNLSWA
jgi:isoquinoline 1-oxidoreductase beta subunit